ncbi:hypothetical protein MTO96_045922, partial [Rhipicephalus appendiculatus]
MAAMKEIVMNNYAATRKPAGAPLEKFPHGLLQRPRILRHPPLAPIREEVHDPLFKHPGALQTRPRLLKRPSLPPIPEE